MRCLVLGATGRTGRLVVEQLLARGVAVRALVRRRAGVSATDRVPVDDGYRVDLEVVETEVASLAPTTFVDHVQGCDAVVSCLGPNVSLHGVFGPPHDLVTRAVGQVIDAAEGLRPDVAIRLVLMSSVSVNRPARADTRRGAIERAFLWALRGLLPPARDNQRAADLLVRRVGSDHPSIEWVAVRPDSLVAGPTGDYEVHEALVTSVFRADATRIADVAHFIATLVTDPAAWERWRGRMPVIVSERRGERPWNGREPGTVRDA